MNLENITDVLQTENIEQSPVQEQEYEESSEHVNEDLPEETALEQEQPQVEAKFKNSNQDNIRNLRERAERAERAEKERDKLLEYVLAHKQSEQPRVNKVEPAEEDYLASIGLEEDSLVEGKHFKQYLKKQRELEKELYSYKQKTNSDTIEMKLKSEYPDFDKVLSSKNLTQLRNINPDLADVILSTPDLYKQGSIAYQMIKQYGIHQEPVHNPEKEMMNKNFQKPRSASLAAPQSGSSAISQANIYANGLTDELKAKLYQEVLAAAGNRNR